MSAPLDRGAAADELLALCDLVRKRTGENTLIAFAANKRHPTWVHPELALELAQPEHWRAAELLSRLSLGRKRRFQSLLQRLPRR